jgi:hypothetical protein
MEAVELLTEVSVKISAAWTSNLQHAHLAEHRIVIQIVLHIQVSYIQYNPVGKLALTSTSGIPLSR